MTLKMILLCACGVALVSCNSGVSGGGSVDNVSGTYVRRYAAEITNPNTGDKVGIRQIRDSIFINSTDNGYQVSNRKWRMNEYDKDGWVSMAHADDRPLQTFLASYDERSEKLNPLNSSMTQSIFIDEEGSKLFLNSSKDIEYTKVK
jgi:hypothetical protein